MEDELKIGTVVSDRIVLWCTKTQERTPGDSYASWVAICYKKGEFHEFVVWDIVARPEGWYACLGDYCHDFQSAQAAYELRGGISETVF